MICLLIHIIYLLIFTYCYFTYSVAYCRWCVLFILLKIRMFPKPHFIGSCIKTKNLLEFSFILSLSFLNFWLTRWKIFVTGTVGKIKTIYSRTLLLKLTFQLLPFTFTYSSVCSITSLFQFYKPISCKSIK